MGEISLSEELLKFAENLPNPSSKLVLDLEKREKLRVIMSEYKIDNFYHITDKSDLVSIKRYGLFSKNLLHRFEIPYMDIANSNVQRIRNRVSIGNRQLHDYVPLFFAKRTPMIYKVKKREGYNIYDIVVLCIRPEIFFLDGVYFLDGNAAGGRSDFYSNTQSENLKQLNWELIQSGNWNDIDEDLKRIQRNDISAELLVPDWIQPKWIEQIIPYDRRKRDFFF
jgi:hypothetical protein